MDFGKQSSLSDESEEYREFVDKFKPKKTTDDCYTPQAVYDAILEWFSERYSFDQSKAVRPFYPGGDFESYEYQEGCIVVDNPPFSILSKIRRFYIERSIPYVLFAPSLTCLPGKSMDDTAVIADLNITYENGAVVRTAFVTNMDKHLRAYSAPDLMDKVQPIADAYAKRNTKKLDKYEYPDDVITAAKLGWMCCHHTPLEIRKDECVRITTLDDMRERGKSGIFGSGLLLSERAAAERAAAERAAAERAAAERAAAERAAAENAGATFWKLSEREREIQRMIGGGC